VKDIRDYAHETLLEAKLKVIKRAMEPETPTKSNPFPNNSYHQWNEQAKNRTNYQDLVDQKFMGLIKAPDPEQSEAFIEQ